jgi:hypothetical protein
MDYHLPRYATGSTHFITLIFYSNNIRRRVEIMKVTIIHVPSLSYFFLFLQVKYTPQHFILAKLWTSILELSHYLQFPVTLLD